MIYRILANSKSNYLLDYLNDNKLESVVSPIICAISKKTVNTPVRNKDCQNTKCVFSLKEISNRYSKEDFKKSVNCPNCNKSIKISEFFIDQGLNLLLEKYKE